MFLFVKIFFQPYRKYKDFVPSMENTTPILEIEQNWWFHWI